MGTAPGGVGLDAGVRELARELAEPADLAPLAANVGSSRFVGIGEASHGTHEFCRWRLQLTRQLIDDHGFTWIGVEGDWSDCQRVNQWVRALGERELGAHELLASFERWPSWLWANEDVAQFLIWLRERNLRRPPHERVGFYGLDIYALRDVPGVSAPERESWNIRDIHLTDTVGRITRELGPNAKGIIWAHNTRIGDARATGLADRGLVSVGELLRERHAGEGVSLVGFAAHRGTVLAAGSWGGAHRAMLTPDARPGSLEDLVHLALHRSALFVFDDAPATPFLAATLAHRAIGVVYEPAREAANYLPARLGERFDALLWFERTTALVPVTADARPASARISPATP